MEPNITYDEYDAYIHGYDYNTGFPKPEMEKNRDINPLNSIEFILNFKKQEKQHNA